MLKEQMNKIKEMIKNQDGNNKRKIENLVVFIIILIITIIIINTVWNNDKKTKNNNADNYNDTTAKLAQTTEKLPKNEENTELEQKLENILKNIDGVGNVKVLLTYSESSQTVAMYNEDTTKNDTEETDTRWWKEKGKSNI